MQLGVTMELEGPCKFCFEEFVAPTPEPWLALSAASVSELWLRTAHFLFVVLFDTIAVRS
jgi:hypothetical protein